MEKLIENRELCPENNRENTREFLRQIKTIMKELKYETFVPFWKERHVPTGKEISTRMRAATTAYIQRKQMVATSQTKNSLVSLTNNNNYITDQQINTKSEGKVEPKTNEERNTLTSQKNQDSNLNQNGCTPVQQTQSAQQPQPKQQLKDDQTTKSNPLTKEAALQQSQQSQPTHLVSAPVSNLYVNVVQPQPKVTQVQQQPSLWDKYKYWTIPAVVIGCCIPPFVAAYKTKKLEDILYASEAWVNYEKKLTNKQFLAKTYNELINEWLPVIMQKYKSNTHKHAVEDFLFDIEQEIRILKTYIYKSNFFRGIGLGNVFGFYEDMIEMAQRKLEIALFLEENFRQWLIQENKRILLALPNLLHVV